MLGPLKQNLRKPLLPVARWLDVLGAKPNHLTFAGLLAAALSGAAIALGHPVLGLIWLVVGLLCDMLDGDLARLTPGRSTPLGAFLDSTIDRASEAFIFTGLLIGKAYHGGGAGWMWLLVWTLALTGSFLVSYTRARAEGLGTTCQVGIAERPERMVLLLLLLIVGLRHSGWFLLVIAVLAWITVYQRIAHVARQLAPSAETPPDAEIG